MAPTTPAAQLTDAKDTELLTLLEGADTVELKLTVPLADGGRGSTGAFDPLGAQIRQVFFFDTRVNWPHHIFVDASFKVVGAN
jgi:hypothetical protein